MFIAKTLNAEKVKASFFFTGNFYRNPLFRKTLTQLKKGQHYFGPHSDQHLLYCDWNKRDSLLVSKADFIKDLSGNLEAMKSLGMTFDKPGLRFFIPPYEWWNDTIASWSNEQGFQLFNFSPGLRTAADYTIPGEKNYTSTEVIWNSIFDHERTAPSGLNGFILLIHIGTDPRRPDKFYKKLPELIRNLRLKGYHFLRINELLK